MKVLFIAVCLLALSVAEPPPSHSYLPPPPAGNRPGNFPGQTSPLDPEVVVARNLNGNGRGNPFARNGVRGNGGHLGKGRLGKQEDEGYDYNSEELARNALEAANEEPANYNFEYMVNDQFLGTEFGHQEERQDERAQGQYHVVLPDGRKQTVNYEADERGFKPRISYEDSDEISNSNGYDANGREIDADSYENGGESHEFQNGGRILRNGKHNGNGYSNHASRSNNGY